ncbi:MAG TPA: protocatechuate 4,5-dioxygenase subunit alpha [Steroidobacteraceae bacterium]|nr:protocatechuate 4,5-dioxygenase subunit alpha [Steroidobacteraceae bacterium]
MKNEPIPGTYIFDGRAARRGYALNKMCYSFNQAKNREEFLADEDSYCARYGLDEAQRQAIKSRDVLALLAAGGNAYYLAKFAGIFGLDMQDIGAQQTGVTVQQFKDHLQSYARFSTEVNAGGPARG